MVKIYTDGSCLKNPGPGGWAALLVLGQTEKLISGGQKDTTNNQMELKAAIEGLKALKRPCEVRLYADSQYVVKGMKHWVSDWQKTPLEDFQQQARRQPRILARIGRSGQASPNHVALGQGPCGPP